MFWNLKPFEYSVCTAKNARRGRGDSVGSVVAGTVELHTSCDVVRPRDDCEGVRGGGNLVGATWWP